MTSVVGITACLCLLLAAVIYVAADADVNNDGVNEVAEIESRYRRQIAVSSHGSMHGDDDMPGRRRGRQGRRRRPGRRGQGRQRGQGRGRGQGRRRNRMNNGDTLRLRPGVRRLISTLAASQNTFTANLHREVGHPNPNVVYSSYSIHQALTMTSMGARRRTALQMKRVLFLQGLGRRAHRVNRKLNMLMNNPGNATLETANAVYVKPGINVERQFSNGLQTFYSSNITLFDMEHPDGPEAPINEWVSTQTHNLISSILPPGTITPRTAMVLVNAIYFKAKWKTPFMERMTREQMFRMTPTEQVPVQMMEIQEQFKTGVLPGKSARVLELSYEGDRFSMLVILPDAADGLATIEQGLTAEHLSINLDTAVPDRVKVFLPRFKIETSLSLKENLKNIGLTLPFNEVLADFSGINGQNDLFISKVIHRAVVDVNEKGSEAAASTAVILVGESAPAFLPRRIPEFRCDHPFLFLIRDNISKVNLFVGKFSGGS